MNEKEDIFDEVKPKEKLFGSRAARVTTEEMKTVFAEISDILSPSKYIQRMDLSKPLPSKEDHGDVDIVVQNFPGIDLKEYIRSNLVYTDAHHLYLRDVVYNGPIMHCLFDSKYIKKQVHVDFIFANINEYDSTLMYLQYGDFSGILGVIARKLKYNYGNKGIFKIYIDKKGQYHYILISYSLIDGLKILGYGDILEKYNTIQNNQDVADFISSSDLFASDYLTGSDLNRGDRKKMRAGRPSARDLKEKLMTLNKLRIQLDDDYYLKILFPDVYEEYLRKCKTIEEFVFPKSKYNGKWIFDNFTNLKPGPLIGEIQRHWLSLYGHNLESMDENQIISATKKFLVEKI